MKVVIAAGGKGTRISSLSNGLPKPMIPIKGKPILEREILSFKEQGFVDFIITISHLGNVISDYFGDGSKLGVHIEYFYESVPLGNAGALFKIKDKLTEDFLFVNADSLFNVDLNRFIEYHYNKGGLVTLFAHPNSHPFDSGLLVTDSCNSVIQWLSKEDKRPSWYHNLVNAGIHIISPKILEKKFDFEKIDLDRDLLKPLCGTRKMFAYSSSEYIKDMGTPERLRGVISDYESGIVEKKCLINKQKAIFLDRDGTINKYVGFLKNVDQMELVEGASEAIKIINESGYLAIVVTNQPVIARGDVSLNELADIHAKMETLLGHDGAYLDALYFCPHHPDKGFPGERPEYKIECDCRKPKPGMLLKAAQDFNIDLSNSWIIGDDENDVGAGKAAGCKTVMITNEAHGDVFTCDSLLSAVRLILGK